MTTIAELTIEMSANVARLQADMQRAVGTVQGATAKMQAAAEMAGKALGLIGVGLSVAAFTGFIRKAIDAADAVGKLSNSTGIATRDISGLQMAYEQAGLSSDAFATSAAKLSRHMADGSKELEAMGVKARNTDGSLRNTKDVLYDVADKFAGYADGAGKAALAQELFGKSGAQMIPLLNGGAEAMRGMQEMAEKLGLTIEQDTADKAAAFNDNLDTLQRGMGGIATRVAAELLPTLSTLSGEFLTATTQSGALEGAATTLSTALKLLYSAGVFVVQALSTVGKTVVLLFAQIAAALKGDFSGAIAMGRDWSADMKSDWSATAKTIDTVWNSAGNAAMDSMSKLGGAAKAQAPHMAAIKTAASDSAKAAEEALKQYSTLMLAIRERITASEQELAAGQPLTAAQKAEVKVLETLNSIKGKVNATQRTAIELALAEAKAKEYLVEQQHANVTATKELAAAEAKRVQAMEGTLAGMAEQNQRLIEEVQLIGLTTQAQRAILSARRSSVIAIKEEQLARMQNANIMTREQIALEEEIRLLKERNGLMGDDAAAQDRSAAQQKSVSEFKDLWGSIDKTAHDTFVNVLQGGQDLFSKLKNTGKSVFFDWLYQMTLKKWLFNFTVSATGTASGVAQAAMGGQGGGGMMGMANNLSSLGNPFSNFSGTIGNGLADAGTWLTDSGFTSMGSTLESIGLQANSASGALNGLGDAIGYAGAVYSLSQGNYGAAIGSAIGTYFFGPLGAAVGGWLGGLLDGDPSIPSVSNGGTTRTYGADGKVNAETVGQWGLGNAGAITNSMATQFMAMQQALMSKGGSTFSFGSHTGDNNENPEFRVSGGSGTKVYDSGLVAANPENMQREASRAILAALQSSELPVSIGKMLDALKPGDMSAQQIEEAIKSVAGFILQVQAMGPAIDMLPLANLKGLSFDAAAGLVQTAGGIEKLNEGLTGFMDNFVTDGERRLTKFKQITAALNAAGADLTLAQVMGASRKDFATFAGQIDPTTEQGARLYATLLAVQDGFAALTPELISVAGVTAGLPQIIIDGMLSGDAAGAGALFADTLMFGVQNALYSGFADQITAIISDQLVSPMVTALATGASISEAISGAAIESMVAQANAAAQALNAILTDPTFQSAMSQISAAVSGAVSGSIRTAGAGYTPMQAPSRSSYSGGGGGGGSSGASAADSIKSAWQSITDSVWGEVKRIRGLLEGSGQDGFAAAQARFSIASAQANAGDQDAYKSLPELSRAMLDLAENNTSTLIELQRIRAQTAASLTATATGVSTAQGLKIPAFAGGGFHAGGWAMVGEQGPELAYMPPARIYTAADTRAMQGGGNGAEVAAGLRALADRLDAIEANTRAGAQSGASTTRLIDRVTRGGKAMQTQPAEAE